ncbi:MAG: lamin tail domain-containing protein [Planctomycetota bacterium]
MNTQRPDSRAVGLIVGLAAALWLAAPQSTLATDLSVSINEVHYHPADDSREGEFVELYNFGEERIPLGGWLLVGAVQFLFPEETSIGPGGYLLVVKNAAVFASRYDVPASMVVGEYFGTLDNAGERLELRTPDGYAASYVEYSDSDPWPETADGLGPSLERISPLLDEGDPQAWATSFVVGGTPGEENNNYRDPTSTTPDPDPDPAGSLSIPQGSTWRYFKGRQNPPQPWNTTPFNDGSWLSGPAGFGYDDGDDATILDDMRLDYTSVYVRREFQVQNPAAVTSLVLSVLSDDGFVAYLNGVEVARENVSGNPGDFVPYDDLASELVSLAFETSIDLLNFRQALRPGTNVIAVHGLNGLLSSGDFTLHPWLTGDEPAGPGGGDDTVLIEEGDVWSYLPGDAPPPANWNDFGFDDGDWPTGPSGFGYGDGDDATILDDMRENYVTLFVRREFTIDDPADVQSLTVSVDYDDGFIAYINGSEVARGNVEDDAWDAAPDQSHEAGQPEFFSVADLGVLRAGANVLAIQGHNTTFSSDFSLIPGLSVTIDDGGDPPPPPPPPPEDLERAPRDLVINELSADGADANGGFVELFNPTEAAIDIGGRRVEIYPRSLGSYSIPGGTSLLAGEFLVISEDDLGFSLDPQRALLLTTDNSRLIDSINPRSTPLDQSTARFPDGDSGRVVLTTPSPGATNSLTPDERIVINEIMYSPRAENTGGEFIELYNRSDEAVDLTGWSFTRGISFTFPEGTILAADSYLALARDPVGFEDYYGFAPIGPYEGRLRGDAETVLLRDPNDNQADRVGYADEGTWPEDADRLGPSLELAHPELENRYGAAWRASQQIDGTPGAPNSSFESDPPPVIAALQNSPAIPTSSEPVHVLANVSDEIPLDSVRVVYRRDSGGGETEIPMLDDGIDDDGIAGNRVYGAYLPPQPDRQIIHYFVVAEEAGGGTTNYPEDSVNRPHLYQVDDDPVDDSLARPHYRIIMLDSTLDLFRSRNTGSNSLLNVTFVAHGKAYHNRGIRLRGRSARSCDPLSYRVQFDHDLEFEGRQRININGCNAFRQWIGLDVLQRSGLPTPFSYLRRISFNGSLEGGYRIRVEAADEQFLERAIPDDSDGNLYRGESRANLDYRGESFDRYRNNYLKVTNEFEDDFSDVVDLCFRFDSSTTSNADFPAAIEERVDVREWAHFFAVFAMLGSTENAIVLNNGDDYFLYHRFSDDKWMLLPWDLDSAFDESDQVLFRPTVDQIERFLENPRYAPDYWCSIQSLLESAFQVDVLQQRIDRIDGLFPANSIGQLRNFVGERRDYVLARLQTELTVQLDSGGTLCNGILVPSGNNISLRGEAPGCGTTRVLVNGELASYNAQNNEWNVSLSLDGATTLEILSQYRNDLEVARLSIPISDESGTTPLPDVVQNDLRLTVDNSPYRAGRDVRVANGATLTVDAGVTVIMDSDASLIIDGTLISAGVELAPVRFASEACDENWEGLLFTNGSTGNQIRYTEFTSYSVATGFSSPLVVDGAELEITDTVLRSGDPVIRALSGADVTLRRVAVSTADAAIVADDSEVSLIDATFVDLAGRGVDLNGGVLRVDTCEFENLGGRALSLSNGATADVDSLVVRGAPSAVTFVDDAGGALSHLTLFGCDRGLVLTSNDGDNGPNVAVDSTIIWQVNQALALDPLASLTFDYSNVEGVLLGGTENLSEDPLFRDIVDGDLRLAALSPCRGTGKDGSDMGAYPYELLGVPRLYQRCDANGDGGNDLSDAITTLLRLFSGAADASCEIAADCNGDRAVDVSDAIFNLRFLFQDGDGPPGLYPACEAAEAAECAIDTCLQ